VLLVTKVLVIKLVNVVHVLEMVIVTLDKLVTQVYTCVLILNLSVMLIIPPELLELLLVLDVQMVPI
jgi:hypothetical protein